MFLIKGVLKSFLHKLRLLEAILATAAYAAVASILMVDVIGREIFQTSFLGAQQVAVYGAILAGFLGLTLATSDGGHLRPAFLDFLFPKHDTLIERIGDAISAFFYLGACYVALDFVLLSMDAKDRAPVLYFVVWPLQIIIPFAFLSAGIKHAAFSFDPSLKQAKETTTFQSEKDVTHP